MWTSTCALATGPANSFGGLSQISVPIPLLEFMTTWRNSEINFKVWASGLDLSVHVVAISTRFIVSLMECWGLLCIPCVFFWSRSDGN